MAAEGTTPLAPPQGEAAHGTEGAPSESLAAPQGINSSPRSDIRLLAAEGTEGMHRDGSRTIRSGIASGVRMPDIFIFRVVLT